MNTSLKTCFRCGIEQPLTDFYRHPQMADGHLNKCKTCNKADTAKRTAKIMDHPVTREMEYARHREKRRRYVSAGRAKTPTKEELRDIQRRRVAKHPTKTKARNAVSNAVRDGRLLKSPCQVCGNTDSEGHHEDYSKPLEVKWLCKKHHADADNQRRTRERMMQSPALCRPIPAHLLNRSWSVSVEVKASTKPPIMTYKGLVIR